VIKVDRDIVRRAYEGADFDDLLGDLVKEIELRNYEITRISNIDNVLARKVAAGPRNIGFQRFKIVAFCNLESCSALISWNLLAGVFMPVRFIIYQGLKESGAHIAFLKPTAFARLFDSEPLNRVAAALEEDMNRILEEVAF
jgi:uncharacterized protein (DUF302 family)